MAKVCRLCLHKLQRGSKFFNINAVESYTGFMPYRDQLTTLIPEMALDLIPNPVICNTCRTALKSAYDFKNRCLQVEDQIRGFTEKLPTDTTEIDLTEISVFEIPSHVKELMTTVDATPEIDHPELVQVNVNRVEGGAPEIIMCHEPAEIVPSFVCPLCKEVFPDYEKLFFHKTTHGDEFTCNFCFRSFKTLQYLRKHNSVCSKGKKVEEKSTGTILTKRPHLPAKAKNHLKHWLFRHTDHPYPTDQEKQILMKETNLTLLQVENWFINARRRILQDLTKMKSSIKYEDLMEFHADSDFGIHLNSTTSTAPSISKIGKKMKDI